MRHSLGISDSYFKPTEAELLEEYLKAVPYLTINEENRLKHELEFTKQQKDNYKQILEDKRRDTEKEVRDIKEQLKGITELLMSMPQAERNLIAPKLVSQGWYKPVENEKPVE